MFSQTTQLAIIAAREAGDVLMKYYGSERLAIAEKYGGEPVTAADLASNDVINTVLAQSSYDVLSEESFAPNKSKGQRVWVVDPLDGTADFIKKTDEFSVLIGLLENVVPIVGIVYEPATRCLYVAEKGKGSYISVGGGGYERISVSSRATVCASRALVSRSHLTQREEHFLNAISPASFFKKGSSGLKIAAISRGQAELYFTEAPIKQWDTCAAHCLVEEAGGKITDMRGEKLSYAPDRISHQQGVLVTNGVIHQEVARSYRIFESQHT